MKRMRNLARAVSFVVLMAFAAVSLTGCDASAIAGIIQKIIPVITQIIGAIKGVAGAKNTAATTASGTATIAATTVPTASGTPVATPDSQINEGDDAEEILNSDKED